MSYLKATQTAKKDRNGSLGVKPRTGKYLNCKICNAEYYVKPSHSIASRFCSNKCRLLGSFKRKTKSCFTCGKKVMRPVSSFKWATIRGHKHTYCSRECSKVGVAAEHKGMIHKGVWSMRNADRLFSDYIRERDGWTCRICKKYFRNKSGQLHNSHFWSRKNMATRFDERNCIAMCFDCHIGKFEKKKNGEYKQLMIGWIGEAEYESLRIKSLSVCDRKTAIEGAMVFLKPYLKTADKSNRRSAFLINEDGMSVLDI